MLWQRHLLCSRTVRLERTFLAWEAHWFDWTLGRYCSWRNGLNRPVSALKDESVERVVELEIRRLRERIESERFSSFFWKKFFAKFLSLEIGFGFNRLCFVKSFFSIKNYFLDVVLHWLLNGIKNYFYIFFSFREIKFQSRTYVWKKVFFENLVFEVHQGFEDQLGISRLKILIDCF
jgi:hypothetical protein